MKWLMVIAVLFAATTWADDKADDKAVCQKVARETPVTHPAKVKEEQKIAYDRCMQKRRQTRVPAK